MSALLCRSKDARRFAARICKHESRRDPPNNNRQSVDIGTRVAQSAYSFKKSETGHLAFPAVARPLPLSIKQKLIFMRFRHWRCGTIPRIWYSTKREFSISVISIENLEITPRNDMWLMLFMR
jgi:hypothetical protein